ncbi:MAG TPA: gluconokinase [Casimicrobiaceae bacterium]|jgi:gluconokinase|nr:gluconokinase [Casimicrobiaceae bacterium]
MMVIVMGVCGCGKTTVGRALARELNCEFLDADDFHPAENVAKMAKGVPLTDDDRWPWLDAIVAAMHERAARGRGAVIACSALKEVYRERLRRGGSPVDEVRLVYLKGDAATIAPRLVSRKAHYMPASLLESQFAALEEPGEAIVVDIRQTTDEQARQAAAALRATSDSAA